MSKHGIWGRSLAAVMAAGLVAGCSSSSNKANALLNPDPPGKMYSTADTYLTTGKYDKAAKKFEDLDRDHPYAPEARRAMVMAAYAYFRAGKYPEAISTARRYTTMHPGTKEAPFAHHIIASSYFEEMTGPENDQSTTMKALNELRVLKSRYPESKYAMEADNRIRIALDTLAAKEMEVGRFYLKRKNYLASINRFKKVVAEYSETRQVEEALMRLTEAYLALGIANEAQTAAAVLGHNFPQSQWYKDSYVLLQSGGLAPREDTSTWLSRTWKNLKVPTLKL
ncbi:MAG: outer membrane protein assembly factor BamD [Alphaproteobacteria bacterium]|nr:outer membrane protein assembly factor BamD [Alphaproteobacteria bacterium]